jgi:hypothetical protein
MAQTVLRHHHRCPKEKTMAQWVRHLFFPMAHRWRNGARGMAALKETDDAVPLTHYTHYASASHQPHRPVRIGLSLCSGHCASLQLLGSNSALAYVEQVPGP